MGNISARPKGKSASLSISIDGKNKKWLKMTVMYYFPCQYPKCGTLDPFSYQLHRLECPLLDPSQWLLLHHQECGICHLLQLQILVAQQQPLCNCCIDKKNKEMERMTQFCDPMRPPITGIIIQHKERDY